MAMAQLQIDDVYLMMSNLPMNLINMDDCASGQTLFFRKNLALLIFFSGDFFSRILVICYPPAVVCLPPNLPLNLT